MKRIFRALRRCFCADRTSSLRSPNTAAVRLAVEHLEGRLAPATDFRSVIGADAVQSIYPYRGAGYTVAILDTGIDYRNTDLGGGFGASKRVVAGYDFINNDADPMDDNGHGTHLAGIIGSSNAASPGIAPEVHFIALKVLDANMNGNWTAIDNALQWVIAHKTQYNIVGVNLSLGSGNYAANPYGLLENDFSTLKNLGVFTAVAAGNRYFTYNSQPGLGYPSISPNVVSVGATWTGDFGPATFSTGAAESRPTLDHIVSFTQRSSALSILAPGAWITSTWLNNATQAMGGTSMATAVVSGAAVLLHQAYDQAGKANLATQDNLLKLMKTTGVTVVDTNYGTDNVAHTGLTFKRLNLKAAMDTIGQPFAPPTFAPIADQTLPAGGAIVVPLFVTTPNGQPVTFNYTLSSLPALAYQLDQQYALNYLGSAYKNMRGLNEQWIFGKNNTWYALMPNGDLRRWAGSVADLMSPTSLIATLDASYHSDPSKLCSAPAAGTPPVVLSISGNKLSIRSTASWAGTVRVTVTASDGHATVQQSFDLTQLAAVNATPVLAPIANQTMSHAKGTLALALSAADADTDPITFSAQVLPINGQAPAVVLSVQGNQLTINPALSFVGIFTVQIGASDGKATATSTFAVTVNNSAPVLGSIGDRTVSHNQDAKIILGATDADGDSLTYAAQVLPINGQTPPIQATVQGSQLTLHPTQPIVGAFIVSVTVSDGAASATKTFSFTLTNSDPTLGGIPAQTVAKGQTSLTIALAASDQDNDALTFAAVVQPADASAYLLNQQYAFRSTNATYFQNLCGYNEKWLIDKYNVWYVLMPTGKLYRWAGSIAQTLTTASMVATLDPIVYTEPRWLWDAKPAVTPALTLSFQAGQLTIQRPASLTGIFFIDVTVSDSWGVAKRTIQVTLN